MKWKGEGEMAWTSMPILSMSRSRCSTEVRQTRTFSICLRLVSRESALEKRAGRLAVRRHQVLDHLVGRRDVDVAVDVDAEIAPAAAIAAGAAAPGGGVGAREEHARLLAGVVRPADLTA